MAMQVTSKNGGSMTNPVADSPQASKKASQLIVAACFLVAALEGIDIQSMGVAAPLVGPEFGLMPAQVGWVLSASLVGLLIGAAVGGWLADRLSRRTVLIGSVTLLGVFSLATTVTWDLPSLLVARLLTGLGMGGAFPTLIAIASESVSPRARGTAISLMYCGMPIGGAFTGLLAASTIATYGWRPVFYLGGIGPLLIIPFLIAAIPKKSQGAASTAASQVTPGFGFALFGAGRTASTLLLWGSYFFTLLIVYLLLNWLPSLMVANGFTKPQSVLFSTVMNSGAAIGSVALGVLLDRMTQRTVVTVTYLGSVLALAALASFSSLYALFAAAFAAGFFGIGGQLLLYALAPNYYPFSVRGTGIGSAVAIGRFGAIAGPIVAGQLLSSGAGASGVLAAAIPSAMIGGVAALALLRRPRAAD